MKKYLQNSYIIVAKSIKLIYNICSQIDKKLKQNNKE